MLLNPIFVELTDEFLQTDFHATPLDTLLVTPVSKSPSERRFTASPAFKKILRHQLITIAV